jgi:hypothetical protein
MTLPTNGNPIIPLLSGEHIIGIFILLGLLAGLKIVLEQWVFDKQRERRRTYYRETYLSSDDWRGKRALVLKCDNYRCVYCGARATQVHHQRAHRVACLGVQVLSRCAA